LGEISIKYFWFVWRTAAEVKKGNAVMFWYIFDSMENIMKFRKGFAL